MRVNVLLFGRASASGTFTLEVSFERTLLVNQADLKGLRLFSDPFVVKTQREISLSAGGKLKITVKRGAGKYDGTDAQDKSPLPQGCSYEAATIPLTFDVVGHYHFSAGVMVSYTRLTDRTFSRQTGDDGVVRIGQQSSPGVDYIANVVGYPFGVDENKDPLAVGILFGTSLSDLGKRWYGGLEIASPIGLGLSGGVAVVVVPRLDEPLLVGQPFSGDQLATHDAAEPTWYLGINLQAELFKTAFGALFSKGED